VLLEHPQVAALTLTGLVTRADHKRVALVSQHMLGAADQFREERVGDVQ